MDITFLIGNGFDLSMGFKTSYRDFYNWYLPQSVDNSTNAIRRLKDSIKADIDSGTDNWADFEIGLGKFTETFNENESNELMEVYENVTQRLVDYLSNLPSWDSIDNISQEQWSEIRTNLCHFYREASDVEKSIFTQLKANEQNHAREAIFHIVSFNYTNYLDMFVEKIAQKPLEIWKNNGSEKKHYVDPLVMHVHGPLSEFPILGVSHKEQILNQSFQKNDDICATLIKNNAIKEIGSHRYQNVKEIIKKSSIICLLGMSLGDSDAYWWKTLNEWVKTDSSHRILIFWYTQSPPSKICVSEYRRRKQEIRQKLLCHSKFSSQENKDLQNRIHVIFNTQKVFLIPETKKAS